MTNETKQSAKKEFAKKFVRYTTILYVVLLLPSIALALSIIRLFSQPGAFAERGYYFMGLAALTLPVILILSIFVPRTLNKEFEYDKAVWATLWPCVNLIVYLVGFLLSRIF